MLVHDPAKFPLVGELGFAVAPGTETFVSIQKNEVSHGKYILNINNQLINQLINHDMVN